MGVASPVGEVTPPTGRVPGVAGAARAVVRPAPAAPAPTDVDGTLAVVGLALALAVPGGQAVAVDGVVAGAAVPVGVDATEVPVPAAPVLAPATPTARRLVGPPVVVGGRAVTLGPRLGNAEATGTVRRPALTIPVPGPGMAGAATSGLALSSPTPSATRVASRRPAVPSSATPEAEAPWPTPNSERTVYFIFSIGPEDSLLYYLIALLVF